VYILNGRLLLGGTLTTEIVLKHEQLRWKGTFACVVREPECSWN
jgi:hypothetical protein